MADDNTLLVQGSQKEVLTPKEFLGVEKKDGLLRSTTTTVDRQVNIQLQFKDRNLELEPNAKLTIADKAKDKDDNNIVLFTINNSGTNTTPKTKAEFAAVEKKLMEGLNASIVKGGAEGKAEIVAFGFTPAEADTFIKDKTKAVSADMIKAINSGEKPHPNAPLPPTVAPPGVDDGEEERRKKTEQDRIKAGAPAPIPVDDTEEDSAAEQIRTRGFVDGHVMDAASKQRHTADTVLTIQEKLDTGKLVGGVFTPYKDGEKKELVLEKPEIDALLTDKDKLQEIAELLDFNGDKSISPDEFNRIKAGLKQINFSVENIREFEAAVVTQTPNQQNKKERDGP